MRTQKLIVAGLLAVAVSAGACKKTEKKVDPATPPTPTGTTAEQPAAPGMSAPGAPVGTIADDLSLIPVDSEVVMGINFAQVQTSALWKQFAEPQMMKGDFQQKLGQFKAKCGFDPMAAIQTMSIGMKGVGGDKPDGVIIVRGVDKAKSLACVDTMKAEAAKSGDEITRDGDVVLVKSKDGETVAVTFVNDTTAFAVIGPQATAAGVKQAALGGSTLKSSPAFVEMYGKIKTGQSMWLLVNGNTKAFDKAAAMGVKPKAVFGSINITDGLSVDMRMRVDSPDQATQMATAFRGQAEAMKSMVDQLDITSEASDIKVGLALSGQKLQQLVAMFGGMFGGGMGGGRGGSMGGGTP
ncbi:MAG: hypothetical protein H0X17_01100 [Deltaproteobacteria bacterium]|nr:hypothetical protein [Deltaproteobacteria bacterium]